MKRRYKILLAIGAALLAWKLITVWWNPDELVTLHGKDLPVADVLKSFSSQTHRIILHPPDLDQKVTVELTRVPLEDALEIVSEEADLRHSRIFVLASDAGRRKAILDTLAGQTDLPVLMQLARGSRWMTGEERKPGVVTYRANAKPPEAAVAEINMATDSYFYLAGGSSNPITVDWKDLPVRQAAAQLASLTRTDDERLYQFFQRRRDPPDHRRTRSRSSDFIQQWRDQIDEEIEKLPPEQKAVVAAQWQKQQERMKEFASMTDEQRLERMMQRFTSGNQEERLIRRLKNSTPESRAKRYQRYEARRKANDSATPPPANPKPAASTSP
jgi:hypothetical protein